MSVADVETDEETVEEEQDYESDSDETITDDERADIDVSDVADRIDHQAREIEDEEADGEEQDEEDDDSNEEKTSKSTDRMDLLSGEAYVTTVGILAVALAEGLGDGSVETDEDEVADFLRTFDVDAAFDELLREQGIEHDLPPGKTVAFATAAVVLLVLVRETDLVKDGVAVLSDELNL